MIEYVNEIPEIGDYFPLFQGTGWNSVYKMEQAQTFYPNFVDWCVWSLCKVESHYILHQYLVECYVGFNFSLFLIPTTLSCV